MSYFGASFALGDLYFCNVSTVVPPVQFITSNIFFGNVSQTQYQPLSNLTVLLNLNMECPLNAVSQPITLNTSSITAILNQYVDPSNNTSASVLPQVQAYITQYAPSSCIFVSNITSNTCPTGTTMTPVSSSFNERIFAYADASYFNQSFTALADTGHWSVASFLS
jgi:hypothetical protein